VLGVQQNGVRQVVRGNLCQHFGARHGEVPAVGGDGEEGDAAFVHVGERDEAVAFAGGDAGAGGTPEVDHPPARNGGDVDGLAVGTEGRERGGRQDVRDLACPCPVCLARGEDHAEQENGWQEEASKRSHQLLRSCHEQFL
jgi:hypothetical protein